MSEVFQGWAAWHPTKGFGETPNACWDIDDAIKDAQCQTNLDDDPAWKAVRVEVRRLIPLAWDAYSNRYYEPVELRAQKIYERFDYDGPPGTKKPDWCPHGNGTKQDEARNIARRLLREAGHTDKAPIGPAGDRGQVGWMGDISGNPYGPFDR